MLKKSIALVGIVGIQMAVVLVTAEIILRSYFPITTYYMVDRGGLAEYVGWSPIVANDGGAHPIFLCDNDHKAIPSPSVGRILLVGDSLLDCNETGSMPFENTIPYLLQKQLGKAWDVYNLSAGGWGTDQEYLAYKLQGEAIKPQTVVLFFTPGNDLYNNSSASAIGGVVEKPHFELIDGKLVLVPMSKKSDSSHRIRSVYASLELYKRVKVLSEKMQHLAERVETLLASDERVEFLNSERYHQIAPSVWPIPSRYQRSWEVTEQILSDMNAEVKKSGAEFVIFVLPTGIPNMCDATPMYPKRCIGYEAESINLMCAGRKVVVRPFQQGKKIKDFGEKYGIVVLDAYSALGQYNYKWDEISKDCLHFTDRRGVELVATILADYLLGDVSRVR